MKGFSLLFFYLLLTTQLKAQTQSSVYSENGLGLFLPFGEPNYQSMGGVGIGTPNIWHPNTKNPAYLVLNSLTTFQVGLETDRRKVSVEGQEENRVSGGLRYLNLSFPAISGKWTTAFSLRPLTTVNYEITGLDSISGGILTSTFKGSGGITSLLWSNGFRITDELFLGVKGIYLFGSLEDEVSTDIIDDAGTSLLVDFTDQKFYNDLNFSISAAYRKKFRDEKFLNVGFIYEPRVKLDGTNTLVSETSRKSDGVLLQESTLLEGVSIATSLPTRMGFGLSYELFNRLQLGLDFERAFWNEVESELTDSKVQNTTEIGFGASWTPDFSSINNYFERATYRFGLTFSTLPYTIEDETISDFGINIGGRFPAGPARVSSLDLSLQQGWLGTTRNGLVREAYFKIVFGVTINDRWFVKRRYD